MNEPKYVEYGHLILRSYYLFRQLTVYRDGALKEIAATYIIWSNVIVMYLYYIICVARV